MEKGVDGQEPSQINASAEADITEVLWSHIIAGDTAGVEAVLAGNPGYSVTPEDMGRALLVEDDDVHTVSSCLLQVLLKSRPDCPHNGVELANSCVDPLALRERADLPGVVQTRLATYEGRPWVEAGDDTPYTLPLLHLAACLGHSRACSLLLSAGARVMDRDDVGSTCLIQAAASGNLDTLLVMAGHIPAADSTASSGQFSMWRYHDMRHNTALHEAVSCGHEDIVECIVKNRLIRPCLGVVTPAELAVRELPATKRHRVLSIMARHCQQDLFAVAKEWAELGKEEGLRILLQYCGPVTGTGDSLLHAARDEAVVQLLLQGSPHLLDSRDSQGFTPLLRAASAGRWDAVKALLAAGADPWRRDQRGKVALHHAAAGNSCACMSLEGFYPVYGYVLCVTDSRQCCKKLQCLRLLAERQNGGSGDVLNEPDENGDTPLHSAIRHTRLDSAALLLCLGARPCPVNRDGKTPLMLAPEDTWLGCFLLFAQVRTPKEVMAMDIDHVKQTLVATGEPAVINTVLLLMEVLWVSNAELAQLKQLGRERSVWDYYKKRVPQYHPRLTDFCRNAVVSPIWCNLLRKRLACPLRLTEYIMYSDYIDSIREGLFTHDGFLLGKVLPSALPV